MQKGIEKSLLGKLSRRLPRYLVQCSTGLDGIVTVKVRALATDESWFITGITLSLKRRGALDRAVEQILAEISLTHEELPLSLPGKIGT